MSDMQMRVSRAVVVALGAAAVMVLMTQVQGLPTFDCDDLRAQGWSCWYLVMHGCWC